ncbi:Kinesin-like protein KIN-14I [Camellia lanceoleosa]|uniref:Kinesin-like protein KIN-14I n=1 Tax=Camellia lanceoleosa TaxID=1840588 RepID=A0ACC0I2R4_9ERIC|nr:Kinesin-like protein KIN-14I [Camellia lanceoleosa]
MVEKVDKNEKFIEVIDCDDKEEDDWLLPPPKVSTDTLKLAKVFSDTQPLIRSVLDGYNVCIFANGQTGLRKTYIMSGPTDLTEQNQGVNYKALGDLFLLAEQEKNSISYDVSVQTIEIYNEQVRDLLITDGLNKRYHLI